jgi:2,4-dienoyl-CoA reductase-like NADH-dependent reductase (Old Yellow Enzyme family)
VTAPTAVFEPADLGPVRLRNRVIKAATFESMSPDGLVTAALVDFHRTVAAGGVGMTTVAYCAVSPEGRGAPNEIVLRPEAAEGLAGLAEAVHAEGAAVSAQIGHAGPVGNSRVTRARALSASSGFSVLGTRYTAMAAGDIARVVGDFARGARLLADAGFDAVEIHMGHHYLVNSFLSPRFNRRKDGYGGGTQARARFAREIASAVRDAVGPRVAVLAKYEMTDAVPGGLWLDESIEMAALLEADGALDALELTAGGSLANPMYLFRGEVPRREFAAVLPPVQRLGYRVVGKRFMPEYPFEEAYFLPMARQFRAALDLPLVLLGGINRLDTMEAALAEGFGFVALGRALLREPDLVRRLQEARATGKGPQESLCIHCNKCMPTVFSGTHCVLVDPDDRPGLRVLDAR